MASSVSGQDESNPALCLATRAGKMELYLARSGLPAVLRKKNFSESHNYYDKSFIDQARSVKMAGYWPRSFFFVFMDRDGVEVHKHAKKELVQYLAILYKYVRPQRVIGVLAIFVRNTIWF